MGEALDGIHSEALSPASSPYPFASMTSTQPVAVHWAVKINHRNLVACAALLANRVVTARQGEPHLCGT